MLVAPASLKGICFNCGAKDSHPAKECPKPPVQCEVCNIAGHLPQFCLVKNFHLPIPSYISGATRAKIENKRDKYMAAQRGESSTSEEPTSTALVTTKPPKISGLDASDIAWQVKGDNFVAEIPFAM